MHIAGELNSLADLLSRTVQSNSYRLDSEWFATHVGTPDFDLTGNALHSYAPRYPLVADYRCRPLRLCPSGRRSVAVPQWGHILPLLQALIREELTGHLSVVLPAWPGAPWYPLLQAVPRATLRQPPGRPWLTPGRRRTRWTAVILAVRPASLAL